MARHTTHKSTRAGKAETIARRQARALKHGKMTTRSGRKPAELDALTLRVIRATDERMGR